MIKKASYQIFEFAWKKEPTSDNILDLMCHSASYVLHVVAALDEVTEKTVDSPWQWEDRSKLFGQMKKSLHEWIARKDVIGGSMFGGSIPRYDRPGVRKNRGKRELKVYCILLHVTIMIIYVLSHFFSLQCWNMLLSVDGGAQKETEDWHNIIKQLIDRRLHDVVRFQIRFPCVVQDLCNHSTISWPSWLYVAQVAKLQRLMIDFGHV